MQAGSTLVAFEIDGGKAAAFRFQDALELVGISGAAAVRARQRGGCAIRFGIGRAMPTASHQPAPRLPVSPLSVRRTDGRRSSAGMTSSTDVRWSNASSEMQRQLSPAADESSHMPRQLCATNGREQMRQTMLRMTAALLDKNPIDVIGRLDERGGGSSPPAGYLAIRVHFTFSMSGIFQLLSRTGLSGP
jgi:hypothetical protein